MNNPVATSNHEKRLTELWVTVGGVGLGEVVSAELRAIVK